MISKFLNLIHDVGFLVLVAIKAIHLQSNDFKMLTTRERAMVLGNGPSLQSDMQTILNRRMGADLYCVNAFALTDYFTKLKPDFYVFADPMYWIDDINEDMKKIAEILYLFFLKLIGQLPLFALWQGFHF